MKAGDVVGLAARDEGSGAAVGVDHDLLVEPLGAGVAQVGLQARPRGELPTLDHVRLHQRPGRVADGGHDLSVTEERLGEGDRVGVGAQRIGVGHAAGQDQRVVGPRIGVGDLAIGGEHVGLVEVVEALDLGRRRHQVHGRAGVLDRVPRLGQLNLLHPFGGEEGDGLAGEVDAVSHEGSLDRGPWEPFRSPAEPDGRRPDSPVGVGPSTDGQRADQGARRSMSQVAGSASLRR